MAPYDSTGVHDRSGNQPEETRSKEADDWAWNDIWTALLPLGLGTLLTILVVVLVSRHGPVPGCLAIPAWVTGPLFILLGIGGLINWTVLGLRARQTVKDDEANPYRRDPE